MKTLATKLTTTSLLAIAICAAPSGLAQEAEKSEQAAAQVQSTAQSDQNAPNNPSASATANAEEPQPAKTSAGADDQKNQNQDSAAQTNAATEQPKADASAVTATATAANKDATAGGNLRIATDDMKKHSADKLAGRELRSSDGKEIGEVKEFLVDTRTGAVAYGIISSGGVAGIGDDLRLVPMKALKATGDDKKFTVGIDSNQWKQLPTIQEKEFKDGHFTIADGQRRQLERQFMKDDTASDAAAYYTANNSEHLIRASALEGRKVRSGNATAGKIESVVIDLEKGTASALFEPEKEFAGSDQKFLVPLGQLTLVGGKRVEVTTMLTAADFKQAQTGGQNVAANRESNEATSAAGAVAASAQPTQPTANENKASDQVASTTTENAQGISAANAQGTAGSEKVASTEQPASASSTTTAAAETAKSSDTSSAATNTEAKQSIATNDSPSASATSATIAQNETTAAGERGATQQKDSVASTARTESTTNVSGDQQAQEVASASTTASATPTAGASQSQKDDALAPTGRSNSQASEADRVAATESKPAADSSAAHTSTEGKSEVAATSTTTTESAGAKADASRSTLPRTATNEATTVADSTPARSSSAADTTPRTTGSSEPKAEPNSGEGQSQRSSDIAANTSTTPQNTDENLTPTGRTSAEQNLNADPGLVTAAQAIRKALDDDPSLARLDVRVTPESGKLHLRGTVQSDDLKRSIEAKAKEAAGGQEIKSELKVGDK